jgi:cytochrome d ubiquinol oxidase subunit II
MSTADAVAWVLWTGLTAYAVFGGADFGAGFWSLFAGESGRGRRARELIDWAIGPVWEANHVWLIFVLVVLWTGFSAAFEAIFSTLFIPLSLAALGIVLRGSGFAFHKTARRHAGRRLAERLFGLSSLLTPFFLGTVVGAVASGRVPVGNATGDPVSSWLNPLSLLIGALFVGTSAYLAAVFLISDARRARAADLERYFTTRALAAAVAAGALAVAGVLVLRSEARYVYDGLTGDGLPLVIASLLCGAAALVLVARGARRGARALAVGAVVAVVSGWGIAQHPYLLPQVLTIDAAAAPSATLTALLIVFGVAVVLVVPAMVLLYVLAQRSLIEETAGPVADASAGRAGAPDDGGLERARRLR